MSEGNPHHDAYGFRSWSNGNSAPSCYAERSIGDFLSLFISVCYAVFTVTGPNIVALSAGEIRNPRKTIPSVVKMTISRIRVICITPVLAVGSIYSSHDPRLTGAITPAGEAGSVAPWANGLLDIGVFSFLPGFINFSIMLSAWSCGNAFSIVRVNTILPRPGRPSSQDHA